MKKKPADIARVVLPIPVDEPFSYLIPEELAEWVQPGAQVIVPVGERYSGGIVLRREAYPAAAEFELKAIHDVVSPEPYVGEDLLALLEWIASYYICNLGEAFRLIYPEVNIHKSRLVLRRNGAAVPETLSPALQEFIEQIPAEDWISLEAVEKTLRNTRLLYRVHKLKKLQLIESRYLPPASRKIYKTVDRFALNPPAQWSEKAREKYLSGDNPRYQNALLLLAHLRTHGASDRESLRSANFNAALLKRLSDEGVLSRSEQNVERQQHTAYAERQKEIILTDAQAAFVEMVAPFIGEKPAHQTFLLHGITGSGKTQIYIELIQRVLQENKQAIVLIPEIVLTPQTMARFYHYFPEQVAVVHSRISAGERLEVLQKVREGKVGVVIGPRSAVFAPFRNLGIIIIDEEHEGSYKQSDALPRYHAREVALYRAYLNHIPVVLGSATPSLESLYNAKTGKYTYYHLDSRVSDRNLPRIQLVDFKEEWRKSGEFQMFSENLLLKLEARLLVKEQVMLLQNRRGFSPYIQCQECGYVEHCPNCDITLTYHAAGRNLRCHYCGYATPAPDLCPQCKGFHILYKGVGTQKIEEEAQARFPHARLLRMDQDTTRRKDDHSRILEKFRRYQADVLIGTKMIAKGLDFERVTLVGIMNADQGLQFPDFRATEKVFQLLVQAAGRAGRGGYSGEVVIQTFDPQHYIFKFLNSHDYNRFYEREMETRKGLNYPPFSRLCLVRVIGDAEDRVYHYAQEIAKYLWRGNKGKLYSVLGPAPAPIVRINNRYRYHVMIKQPRDKDPSMSYLRRLLKAGLFKNPELKKWPVEVQIDIDPVEIL
ncbi:MAG: primosomal protein N' [Calditrichae bacterium]|nr:primosomal protein N' [Calditrichia bacterium]